MARGSKRDMHRKRTFSKEKRHIELENTQEQWSHAMRILGFLKNTEVTKEYVFILIRGMGYGVSSDCSMQRTVICLML